MSDAPAVKLTKAQREALQLCAASIGPYRGRIASMASLRDHGFVKAVSFGRYRPTPAGRALLDALKEEGSDQ